MVWRNPWFDPAKTHHTPQGFRNPEPDSREKGDLKKWQKMRKEQGLPPPPAEGYDAFACQWMTPMSLNGEDDRLWWLGHASLLLRISRRYLLIDPVFSLRASPVTFAGPKRRTPAPLQVGELPDLEAVLISHNHYDHLDKPTIRKIITAFPRVKFFVPVGLENWFLRLGARHVQALDWWQSAQLPGAEIHAVPARHWSRRSLFDTNRSLWCGWVINSDRFRFWFSGDSGFTPGLFDITQRLGPFTHAALPVGAYAPEWFMKNHHMSPPEAVKLFEAAGYPVTVPIHWGVFELGDEALDDPPRLLSAAMQQFEPAYAERFRPWTIGESCSLS